MAMFENFPYTDLHNLNLDWIIKIAKDFLDQYTHIQQLIADGETSLQNLTEEGLQQLQDKADNIESLLNAWYEEHSDDIADQLADALQDLNAWYTLHQGYLDQALTDNLAAFNNAADQKAQAVLESIPDDYTALVAQVDSLEERYATNDIRNVLGFFGASEYYDINFIPVGTLVLGKYIDSNGAEASAADSKCSDFIAVKGNTAIAFNDISIRGARFLSGYDSNQTFVRHLMRYHSEDTRLTVYIEPDIKYIRFSALSDQNPTMVYMAENPLAIPFGELIPNYYVSGYTGDVVYDTESCCTDFVPVKENSTVFFDNLFVRGVRGVCVYDANKDFINYVVRNEANTTKGVYHLPYNARYIRLTMSNTTKDAYAVYQYAADTTSPYIVLGANDDITKAINNGYSVIFLTGGVYYKQIDLTNARGKRLVIAPANRNNRPVFVNNNSMVTESATLLSGYLHVKQAEYTGTFPDGLQWLFQDYINDASTRIRDAERLPQQRGYDYRCDSTVLHKCTATTLAGALEEIETATYYKWYLDSDNGRLYFSSPADVSSNKPIRYSNGDSLFLNNDISNMITLIGIEARYININVDKTTNPVVVDCKCVNVNNAGAFSYSDSVGAVFIRCEAGHNQYGSNGDGFNADTILSYQAFSKYYTSLLIDCWAHDNHDDGWSEHRKGEATIIGGLFEYNGKAGITPSYGDHCTCKNVYSRNNFNGFYLHHAAESGEGGVGSQLLCYGCIAENNDGSSYRAGFAVDGNGNRMICVDCKAIGNRVGYSVNDEYAIMTLYDCRESGNNTISSVTAGTLTIRNTNLVS